MQKKYSDCLVVGASQNPRMPYMPGMPVCLKIHQLGSPCICLTIISSYMLFECNRASRTLSRIYLLFSKNSNYFEPFFIQ